ncbi:MAG: SH3 domain-containing protein [Labilithrix sp.]|nr:SH3 domain-containing protein [Labilithrix sp.]MBX3224174.1 SH3 domain-containing protein [Labilithrix sp.]
MRPLALALALVVAAPAAATVAPGVARAAEEAEAFARVVVDAAELRSGPSISSRVIYTAHRGETFAVDGRQGTGFWLRVVLPDGRVSYALGDEMQVFAVRPGEPDAPSRPGIFATPPLEGANAGFAILGGVLAIPIRDQSTRAFGYLEGRPSIVVHRTVTLDGYIANALTADGSQIFYGGGATVHFAPSWAICPFLGIGGGGLSVRPNADSFVLKREDLWMARAGGGVLMALRGRILVRLEATNLTLFDSESLKNAQTYAGGFGVYF